MFFNGFPGHPGGGIPGAGIPGAGIPGGQSGDTRLYRLLEVSRDADDKTIKKAYRKLAMKWHPDKNQSPEAESRFKDITWAHSVLSDPEKRKLYDAMGEKAVQESGDNPGSAPSNPFNMFFGGGGPGRPNPEDEGPKPVVVRLNLTLPEMYRGGEFKVNWKRDIITDREGEPRFGGTRPCPKCDGRGIVLQTIQIGPGMMQQRQMACPNCQKRGYIMEAGYCLKCETQDSTVKIPPGIENRGQVTLKGQGHIDPKHPGSFGDVVVVVEQHSTSDTRRWDRKGPHLVYRHKISVFESLVGTTFYLTHPSGKIFKLSYPHQIPPETVKRLPGKGMPVDPESTPPVYGEMFVAFDVYYPKLTSPQKSLLQSWIPPPTSITSTSSSSSPSPTPESYKLLDHEPHGRHRPTTTQQEDHDPGNIQCQTQ